MRAAQADERQGSALTHTAAMSPPRSRSPAPDLRAALAEAMAELAAERDVLAAAQAALAAAQAALAAERNRAAALQWQWLDSLHAMADDARALAVLAHRAGASGDLIGRWYAAPPPQFEPEDEPEPR
jgi:hypothetical protein